jgi:hypothetical protein
MAAARELLRHWRVRRVMIKRRVFYRDDKVRLFCPCKWCRLRLGGYVFESRYHPDRDFVPLRTHIGLPLWTKPWMTRWEWTRRNDWDASPDCYRL